MQKNPFENIPEVQFADTDMEKLLSEMIADYEGEYFRQTGVKKSIVPASQERIELYTEAYRFHLIYQMIDRGLKMNLLKYAEVGYLDNLAALFGIERLPEQPSVSRVRFTLSAPQGRWVRIPAGTRVSAPEGVVFATTEETVIKNGELSGACNIESLTAGAATGGILPGQISVLLDPVPFVSAVENTLSTQGGTDVESDQSLRLRVYYFKDSYSTAGPESAYRYFIQSFSQGIEGISIHSPEPGVTDVRITLTGGVLPEQPFLDKLHTHLFNDKRPLTDSLRISPPDILEYTLSCTYYISQSDRAQSEEIQKKVTQAAADYTAWQSAQIGRDISPDKLTGLIMAAGAKRVPITSPTFTPVNAYTICKCTATEVIFGGVEDD